MYIESGKYHHQRMTIGAEISLSLALDTHSSWPSQVIVELVGHPFA